MSWFKKVIFKFNYLGIVGIVAAFLLFYVVAIINNSKYDTSSNSSTETAVNTDISDINGTDNAESSQSSTVVDPNNTDFSTECLITVFDVDNALCVLIESNGEYMLFDGGDYDTQTDVVSYLKDRGITSIKYLVASHFHSDHVYGLIGVLNNLVVENVMAPDYVSSTNCYENFYDYVDKKEVIHPYAGQIFQLGDITLRTISPVDDAYSDDNGYSIGFVGEYKDFHFLIDGDATEESEIDMLEEEINLSSDLLIVPHHGSMYSSSEEWLSAVSPIVAVISCGMNNEYYHPHEKVLNRLRNCGIKSLYRTDLQGFIWIESDGDTFKVYTEKETTEEELWKQGQGDGSNSDITSSEYFNSSSDVIEEYYVGNIVSKKFHRPGCKLVPEDEERQAIFSNRDSALIEGYTPCSSCDP